MTNKSKKNNIISENSTNLDETQIISREKIKQANNDQKKQKNNKKIKNLPNSLLLLIIGFVILLIPILIFSWILISAALSDGPVIKNRFEGDLIPSINQENITTLESELININRVTEVEVVLTTATLRVYLDIDDNYQKDTKEDTLKYLDAIAVEAYNSINRELPIKTYFSSKSNKKMYDLEIHVYNSLDNVSDINFDYLVLNQSSNMDNYKSQLVSHPQNADLAFELQQDVINRNNPNSNSEEDINVGSHDVEDPADVKQDQDTEQEE